MTDRSGHKFRAAWLLIAATLLATSASQACVCTRAPLGQFPTGFIKVEDPEPLPDAPATPQQRITPQDRVIQGAPETQGGAATQQPPDTLRLTPGLRPQQQLQRPDAEKGTVDTQNK